MSEYNPDNKNLTSDDVARYVLTVAQVTSSNLYKPDGSSLERLTLDILQQATALQALVVARNESSEQQQVSCLNIPETQPHRSSHHAHPHPQ